LKNSSTEIKERKMKEFKKDLEKEKQEKAEKKQFEEPKLNFIEPKLTKHGDATKITAGFFGSFNP